MNNPLSVLAIACHPDDIEFGMAGTLWHLKEKGARLHYMNVSDGCCGSVEQGPEETARIRLKESQDAAAMLDATFYPPLAHDLEIFYNKDLLSRVAAVIRQAKPDIVLTHSPEDYMEDHMNVCRLVVSAVFAKGMPNYSTVPPVEPVSGPVALYHAQPHGNRDTFSRPVVPDFVVDVSPFKEQKAALLRCHVSQDDWLNRSQGMDAYVDTMYALNREVGAMAGFKLGEGWRRHNPLGYSGPDFKPLETVLEAYCKSPNTD